MTKAEARKIWYEKNKEKISLQRKQEYIAKKQAILQKNKQQYQLNPNKILKKNADYRKRNKEKLLAEQRTRREVESQLTKCVYFDCYTCDFTWEEAVLFDKLFKQHKDKLEICFVTTGNIESDGYVIELFDYRINIDSLADDIKTLESLSEEEDKFYCQAVEWLEFKKLANKLCAFCKKYKIVFILLPRNDWTANTKNVD